MLLPSVDVVVLSRDRPAYLRECINSILSQNYSNFSLKVSDNSSNNLILDMLKSDLPNVKYITRTPSITAIEHFNIIISECTSDYLVMFHDDDIMKPEYLSTMVKLANNNSNCSALVCNGYYLLRNNKSNTKIMGEFNNSQIIYNPIELISPYFEIGKINPPPFPAYFYKVSSIHKLLLNKKNGGKHADLSFLLEVLETGPIYWHSAPLMYYRLHGTNDSKIENIGDRLSLLRYIRSKKYITPKNKLINEYRLKFYKNLSLLSLLKSNFHLKYRYLVILKFIIYMILIVNLRLIKK
jgi:glycosyltransferase involved in cell wall biosynthesis